MKKITLLYILFSFLKLFSRPVEYKEFQKLQDKIQKLEKEIEILKKKPPPESLPSKETAEGYKTTKTEEENPGLVPEEKRPPGNYALKSKGLKVMSEAKIEELKGNAGKRFAIVIGINDYQDAGISDLSKARNDAIVMAEVLKTKGQFDEVYLMTDAVDPKGKDKNLYPTRLNIEEKLDSVLRFATEEDMVLFFFSGHGISDMDEKGYLVTVDTVSDKQYNSSLKVESIVQRFKEKRLKKTLLILDACRNKVYESKSTTQNPLRQEKFKAAEVSATFYSTKAGYFSYEDPNFDFGVFTRYLVYGLEGKADENNDGVVAFRELQGYVQEEVDKWSRDNNKQQKPYVKIYNEVYKDLALSIASKAPETGESLADKKVIKPDRNPYILRSAIFPGFGHRLCEKSRY
ncbi:MAG: caspase family protein [Leptospiraceae bacterium]|nr:caspase family protein [Leptospiraceae bacterium]MCP5501126.1 caspase family protein [Leptospiraceae bacterium]